MINKQPEVLTHEPHLPVLPIVIDDKEFHAGEDRMWSLNEIHRELGLPVNKEPSQWRDRIKDVMVSSANLQTSDGNGTWATEHGAVAYAMWVSPMCSLTACEMVEPPHGLPAVSPCDCRLSY
ncbi:MULTISPECIES: hypothetical protein [Serratia]|uniref:hypothetical protein n=1 Tax=Serratia TaxID=613 RepID=UPI001F2958DD|nr:MULTISPECIES: hypothetical protein [Serratia]CAI1596997.1 Uncharacterised protein [Serratia marcescens]